MRLGDGWWLTIPGPETKTSQPIEMAWPDALVAALERYLEHWRQILAVRGSDHADARAGFLWCRRGAATSTRTRADLLGHRQLAIERHYNLAQGMEAAADYHRALKRLR